MTTYTSPDERPLGYWLTATDRLLAAEFARAFDNEGITRRDWRLLNAIDGAVPIARPIDDRKLGRLIELGWVTPAEDGWALTDEGQAAKKRLGTIVDGIRATIAEAVSADDYATTVATLAQIARALGWDENVPLPRKNRERGGHGRRGAHRHGHGAFEHRRHVRRGFGPHPFEAPGTQPHAGHGFHDHGAFDHGLADEPHHHGRFGGHWGAHRRIARMAQHAYERGFDAGFDRGSTTR
ncbi:hypothetical protein OED01_00565 [Microbacterium sp. M28]|uniref:MarR family winged helix-turn-helix transcriptional regulator n=1 Tax=Microbacterium sp. M28 TaxID=2962064 RepID=UPI0021F477EE|nr:hypothetical protein [Microbacterium sp. M28]UYO97255.1 hypothetical protein OED01_00565 [Microbacterium sp. M28]